MFRAHRSAAFVIVLACLASTYSPASAQPPAEFTPPITPTITLDFAGGTAADYIAALRRASPDANIVVLGDLARIRMMGVQLKNVDVLSALSVLDRLPQDQGGFVAKVVVENVASSQDVPDVYTVTAEIRDRGAAPGLQLMNVISMADLLGENLKVEDALTAVQTALELIKEPGEPAQIKFHEETGLLICRGSADQVENVRQVIGQLRERAGTLEVRAQKALAERHQAEAARNAVGDAAKSREEIEALTRQVSEWRTRAEVLEHTIEEHQRLVATLQAELREQQAERDQLKRALADLQAKVAGNKP